MRVSRKEDMGFLDGLDMSDMARTAYSDAISDILSKEPITLAEARVLRRAGRFATVRLAARDRSLYQDIDTKEFWELKEGMVHRLVEVDDHGIAKEASSHEAGGSTGYYRDRRMEQNPGTYNDGAGEKDVGKFSDGLVDDEDELEVESATGMDRDKIHAEKPFNMDEGPGHGYTAAVQDSYQKGDWVTDEETGEEYQVNKDQSPDGRVDVIDEGGTEKTFDKPQNLKIKESPGAETAQMADRLLDFRKWGRDAGHDAGVSAALEAELTIGGASDSAAKQLYSGWSRAARAFRSASSDAVGIGVADPDDLFDEFVQGTGEGFLAGWREATGRPGKPIAGWEDIVKGARRQHDLPDAESLDSGTFRSRKQEAANTLRALRGDDFNALDDATLSDLAHESHRPEIERIVSSGAMAPRVARTLRRVGRFHRVDGGLYKDVVSGDLWVAEDGTVRRAEAKARKASTKPSGMPAGWDVIESVLGRTEGWVPRFREAKGDKDVGIHLKNPTADDVVNAIHVARKQGFDTIHVHASTLHAAMRGLA